MSEKTLNEPMPISAPVPPLSPQELTGAPPAVFPPSVELGEQLQQLHKAQVEIDRRRAEEIARLREIQNRD